MSIPKPKTPDSRLWQAMPHSTSGNGWCIINRGTRKVLAFGMTEKDATDFVKLHNQKS